MGDLKQVTCSTILIPSFFPHGYFKYSIIMQLPSFFLTTILSEPFKIQISRYTSKTFHVLASTIPRVLENQSNYLYQKLDLRCKLLQTNASHIGVCFLILLNRNSQFENETNTKCYALARIYCQHKIYVGYSTKYLCNLSIIYQIL